ncbi:NADPH-dependent FMN reductase [Motilimonas pumila]|uniref:NADPH-dependent FMN reductase n=1 Tax=Motilimonas pumila TaxID=2303987 RepID=UPI001313E841|nr:NAD(P)H-dependent oxidoreductase [Motilimonas pumila]
MNLVIISGSQRKNSAANAVSAAVEALTHESQEIIQTEVLTLTDLKIPMWDDALSGEMDLWLGEWQSAQQVLEQADAVVIVSPEWEETSLKNFYALCERAGLEGKPSLVVRISSTCRGAYEAKDLSMTNFSYNTAFYVVDHLVVANTDEVTKLRGQSFVMPFACEERLLYGLKLLNSFVSVNSPVGQFMLQSKTNKEPTANLMH